MLNLHYVYSDFLHLQITKLYSNRDNMEVDKLKAEIKSLKEQLAAKFEKYAGNYSNDPDKKMAELMTRNAVLETELENYQKYMKATTKKYEAKIKKLKKKLKG